MDLSFTKLEQLALLVLIFLCLSSFSWEIIKRFKIVLKGEGSLPFNNLGARFFRVFSEFFLQSKVNLSFYNQNNQSVYNQNNQSKNNQI